MTNCNAKMDMPTCAPAPTAYQQQICREVMLRITELADEEYRIFHSNLLPGKDSILGVRVPKLRALAQEIVKHGLKLPDGGTERLTDWREYLEAVNTVRNTDTDADIHTAPSVNSGSVEYPGCYEDVLLSGLVIGTAKMPYEELRSRIETFVPKIDNWATCDIFCSSLKAVQKRREETWAFLAGYLALGTDGTRDPADPGTEYLIRFAVVMLISHFIVDDYIDSVLAVLDQIRHDRYYVKMAVAWALSICFIKYPEKTMALYQQNQLDTFTYNKALQKTVESFRVDAETKNLLRSMKRK